MGTAATSWYAMPLLRIWNFDRGMLYSYAQSELHFCLSTTQCFAIIVLQSGVIVTNKKNDDLWVDLRSMDNKKCVDDHDGGDDGADDDGGDDGADDDGADDGDKMGKPENQNY